MENGKNLLALPHIVERHFLNAFCGGGGGGEPTKYYTPDKKSNKIDTPDENNSCLFRSRG